MKKNRQKERRLRHNEAQRKYRRTHKEKISLWSKEYYQKNKDEINKKSKKYRQEHKKDKKHYDRLYRKINHKNIIKKLNIYIKNRIKRDTNYKLRRNLSIRIYLALKGINKSQRTMKLFGCNINFLKQHLEKQFKKGMNWNNYGKWHIDHIRPCASFNLNKKSEQYKCFNYNNLQPLWAKENKEKRNKISPNSV
jgi:hypothetical protein